MNKTEMIKNVPIIDVIDRLKIQYRKVGSNEFAIIDGGQVTNGWRFNTEKNLVKDFSHGDRGEGDTFGFVKQILNCTEHDVFGWFEKEFGIIQEPLEDKKKSIFSVWKSLKGLNVEQEEYLKKRGISWEKVNEFVRDYNGSIACLVYEGNLAKGLTGRTLSSDKDKRFTAAHGFPSKGIYQHEINKEKKYLIVVEGLMDFLSLRQFDTNIVGLKSAESGVEEIIKLAKDYEIYFMPDQDDAGKKTLEKLKGIKIKVCSPKEIYEEAKDVNDVLMEVGEGAEFIVEYVLEHAKQISPISSTFENMYRIQAIIKERGMLGIPGPFQEIDKYTSGMIPGSVYTIAAYSNTGKSKLAYHYVSHFLKAGMSVCYLSLEVSEWMTLKNVIQSHDAITQEQFIAGHKTDESNYHNLVIRDDIYKLPAVIAYVKSIDSDVIIVDFVQNIQEKGTIYERNAAIAQGMQQLAIETQKIFIDISQISNEQANNVARQAGAVPSLKGAGEYFASSDVVLIMYREKDMEGNTNLNLTIVKNKYGPVNKNFLLKADLNKGVFGIQAETTSEW